MQPPSVLRRDTPSSSCTSPCNMQKTMWNACTAYAMQTSGSQKTTSQQHKNQSKHATRPRGTDERNNGAPTAQQEHAKWFCNQNVKQNPKSKQTATRSSKSDVSKSITGQFPRQDTKTHHKQKRHTHTHTHNAKAPSAFS